MDLLVFRENLKRIRKQSGLTQRELAEKIGKGFSTVQKYELGLTAPPLPVIKEIAIALEVSMYDLFIDSAGSASQGYLRSKAFYDLFEDGLNYEGKKKVMEYAEDLMAHRKYRKQGISSDDMILPESALSPHTSDDGEG